MRPVGVPRGQGRSADARTKVLAAANTLAPVPWLRAA